MARKLNKKEVFKKEEKKVYFASEYKLPTDLGTRHYYIPVDWEETARELTVHSVKEKAKDKGFKGKYRTDIICKSVDEEGNRLEDALCCQYYKDETHKELVGYPSDKVFLPVILLADTGEDVKSIKKAKLKELTTEGSKMCVLQMSKSKHRELINATLKKTLESAELIDTDLDPEEYANVAYKHLSEVLLCIEGNPPKNKAFRHERAYSFVPLKKVKTVEKEDADGNVTEKSVVRPNTDIGADNNIKKKLPSGEVKTISQLSLILNWRKVEFINNMVVEFLELFYEEVDKIPRSWTDQELKDYVEGSSFDKNIRAYQDNKEEDKEVEVVTEATDTETSYVGDSDSITNEIEFNEDDFAMDFDEDFLED